MQFLPGQRPCSSNERYQAVGVWPSTYGFLPEASNFLAQRVYLTQCEEDGENPQEPTRGDMKFVVADSGPPSRFGQFAAQREALCNEQAAKSLRCPYALWQDFSHFQYSGESSRSSLRIKARSGVSFEDVSADLSCARLLQTVIGT